MSKPFQRNSQGMALDPGPLAPRARWELPRLASWLASEPPAIAERVAAVVTAAPVMSAVVAAPSLPLLVNPHVAGDGRHGAVRRLEGVRSLRVERPVGEVGHALAGGFRVGRHVIGKRRGRTAVHGQRDAGRVRREDVAILVLDGHFDGPQGVVDYALPRVAPQKGELLGASGGGGDGEG